MNPGAFLIDLLDVCIVAWLLFRLLLVFRQSRALRILIGVGILVIIWFVARVFEFETILGLLDLLRGNTLEIAVVILAIIFADEIKDAFGGMIWRYEGHGPRSPLAHVADEVARAATSMASKHIGALIAIAKANPLDRWEIADSVPVDARVTAQLLETIFGGKSALHDGAVLIRGGRIVAAKCQFPSSASPAITTHAVGMRHRAAFGLSEMSDAVVVVVSEERGNITVTHRSQMHRRVDPPRLPSLLRDLLEVRDDPKPPWHPRRVLAHGWLKSFAFALAFVLWAFQTTRFTVVDRVRILDPETGAPRDFALEPGARVVVNDGADPVPTAEAARYEQSLPPLEYELEGKNYLRLAYLPVVLGRWWRGQDVRPAALVGPIDVVLPATTAFATPAERRAADAVARPLPLVTSGRAFTLTGPRREVSVALDELASLDTEVLRIAFSGQPAPDYSALSSSPMPVRLIDVGGRRVVVPSRRKQDVEAAIGAVAPCPTAPEVSIEGGKSSFDEIVALQVPDELRRWNPGVSFRSRVVVEVLWDKIRRDAETQELSDAQRRELDDRLAEANRRVADARERWLALERKLKDGTWEVGYRLDAFETLVGRAIPDLEDRVIEKAHLELAATDAKVARLEAEVERLKDEGSARKTDLEIARARRAASVKEQELRREIHAALRENAELLRREAAAVSERLRPLLDAVAAARAERERLVGAELPRVPAIEEEADLGVLIDEDGPEGAARNADAARVIAAAASGRATIELHGWALGAFERWDDALRELAAAERARDGLANELKGAAPASATPIRLELALAEKNVIVEVRREVVKRQAELCRSLAPRLVRASELFARETALLARIANVRGWPFREVARLDPAPFAGLFREVLNEVPKAANAQRFFEALEQPARAPDETIRAEARPAGDAWSAHRAAMRGRLAVIAAVVRRVVSGGAGVAVPGLDAGETEGRLVRLAERQETLAAELGFIHTGERPLRLSDLDDLRRRIEATDDELAAARAARDELACALDPLEKRLEAATQELAPALRAALADSFALQAHAVFQDEAIRRIEALRADVGAAIDAVRPHLEPLVTEMRVRLAEIDAQRDAPQPERDAALAWLEGRGPADAALLALEAALPRLGTAAADPEQRLGDHLVAAFSGLPRDDPGLDHLVALGLRRENVAAIVANLGLPKAAETPDSADTRPEASARAEKARLLREAELAMRTARLVRLDEAIALVSSRLEDPSRTERMAAAFGAALDATSAKAIPREPLAQAFARLGDAIARRRRDAEEARAEAAGREDPTEQHRFARRAELLERRAIALERLREALGTLIERIDALVAPG